MLFSRLAVELDGMKKTKKKQFRSSSINELNVHTYSAVTRGWMKQCVSESSGEPFRKPTPSLRVCRDTLADTPFTSVIRTLTKKSEDSTSSVTLCFSCRSATWEILHLIFVKNKLKKKQQRRTTDNSDKNKTIIIIAWFFWLHCQKFSPGGLPDVTSLQKLFVYTHSHTCRHTHTGFQTV